MERETGRSVLGLDGCPGGWCAVRIDVTREALAVHPPSVIPFAGALASGAAAIAVDIPIGLLDVAGPRACDVEARRLLGRPRASSVFPPPAREVLELCRSPGDYRAAGDLNHRLTGRRLTRQAFNIAPKIREVDRAIKPRDQSRVFEVHPELSFWALNGGAAMRYNKRRREGRAERWALLRTVLPSLPEKPALPSAVRNVCNVDDYIDATVAALTAARILQGRGCSLPARPPHDARGLQMAIWMPQ